MINRIITNERTFSASSKNEDLILENAGLAVHKACLIKSHTPLHLLTKFLQEEDGQALTEYGAVLGFVGVLVATVFSVTHSGLYQSLSTAVGQMANSINHLASSGAS